MPDRAWKFGAVLSVLVGLMLAGLAPAASTEQARRAPASLAITPGADYIGGQALVFSGNIGATGERRVHLQLNAGYSGDVWGDVDGFSALTAADGDFRFVFPAPAMHGIRYRVASGGLATPHVTFDAHSQDLTVEPTGTPRAGVPFELLVDTTPTLARRPDTIGLKPIVGRTLTLQKRISPTNWKQLDTTLVGPLGLGTFTVTEPVGGVHVYRVVQENFFEDGNRIGWFPSFPTYVDVATSRRSAKESTTGSDTVQAAPVTTDQGAEAPSRVTMTSSRTTASQTYSWGVSLFDFAWVFGESLSAKPHRGSVLKGSWVEYIDGGGRVSSHNGGLYFDSKRVNKPGPGDFGTTMATMQGNPMPYGRWEVRLRARSDETYARDYLVRAELVPENPSDYDCGAHNITMGELTAHGSSILVGVNAGQRRWTYRKTLPGSVNNVHFALATEVAKRHITWFINGRPVATVARATAVSDLPMTLRLSLVGDGDREMNDTDILSDWQRGFSLLRGQQVTNGHRMKRGTYDAAC
jgi:hypothetical protein